MVENIDLNEIEETGDLEPLVEELTLGQRLGGQFTDWVNDKEPIVQKLLKNHRAFLSRYESDITSKIKDEKSESYLGVVRGKITAANAKLIDVYLSTTGKKAWEIKTTPKVDEGTDLPEEEIQQIQDAAEKTTKEIEKRIDDQFVEADFEIQLEKFFLDYPIYGTAVIEDEGDAPQRVSIFDVYPDPHASEVEAMKGYYRRYVLNKKEVQDLVEQDSDFDLDAINELLKQNPDGNHTQLSHESQLKNLSETNPIVSTAGRYEILKYWGYIDGHDLQQEGLDVSDEDLNKQILINIWLSDNKILKMKMQPHLRVLNRLPIYIVPFQIIPDELYGLGMRELMQGSNDMIQGSHRRIINDLAKTGELYELDVSGLDIAQLSIPKKELIKRDKIIETVGGQEKPLLTIHKIGNNIPEGIELLGISKKMADEESGLPSITQGQVLPGNPAGTKTLGGLNLLKDQSSMNFRPMVKNIDNYLIRPLLRFRYHYNLFLDENLEQTADAKVNALGSTSLVAKEVESTQFTNFLNITQNEEDSTWVKRGNLIGLMAERMGITAEEAVYTAEEREQNSRDPLQEELQALEVQKNKLENKEIESVIEKNNAERDRALASIDLDKKHAKTLNIQAVASLEQARANNNGKINIANRTRDKIKNDGFKTNNEN